LKEFAELMYSRGWWAHRITDNLNGQPSDVMIARNNITVLVDCKVCENRTFPFDRIEYNQEYSMGLWKFAGNSHAVFALKVAGEIRIMNYATLMTAKYQGTKQFNYREIMSRSLPLDLWEASIICKSE
jgi:hypothetical protein